MKKPKETLRSVKKLYEGLQSDYEAYRGAMNTPIVVDHDASLPGRNTSTLFYATSVDEAIVGLDEILRRTYGIILNSSDNDKHIAVTVHVIK
jgi:hypothetical protein